MAKSDTHGATDGSSTCEDCHRGTYSSAQGVAYLAGCNECPPGRFANAPGHDASSDCAPCPRDTYTPLSKQLACTDCPARLASSTTRKNRDG